MKNFISSIRNKKIKGNVSLLVILILLASSVIALLSISQIQHLITYWDMTFNYFRAFYLAKAGTELGLTEVYNRENGFEDEILNNKNDDGSIEFHDIIKNNFLGEENKYEWAKPYFDMEIVSVFDNIGDDVRDTCDSSSNQITLEAKNSEHPWWGIVISLFKDNTTWFKNILNPEYEGIVPFGGNLEFSYPSWNNFMFWLFSYDKDWNMNDIIVEKRNSLSELSEFLENNKSKISWTRKYLTIKNIWSTSASFCIKGKDIPYSHYLIDVRWNYADMEVGLQSIVKKDIPSWSLNVLDDVQSA